jgi:hypothetical protein
MKYTMRNEIGGPAVVDRSIFQAELDALWKKTSTVPMDVPSSSGRA